MSLSMDGIGVVAGGISLAVAGPAALIGGMNGLRTMTPLAVICWYAYEGKLPLEHTWAFWTASSVSVGVFTFLAIGEYIGDKLPKTPSRTAPVPLLARMAFGAVAGGVVELAASGGFRSLADGSPANGAGLPVVGPIVGAVGAVAGAFAGYHLRKWLTKSKGLPDLPIALIEDAVAIGGSVAAVLLAQRG